MGDYATNAVLTVTDPSGPASGTSNAFAVGQGPLASFAWGAVPSPQVAGEPFTSSVTAQDAAGNTVTSYAGTAALSILVGSPSMMNVGSAQTTTPLPINSIFSKCRTQQVHQAAELGGSAVFSSLALYVTVPFAVTVTDFTIRLKHTSRTGYSGTSDFIWESSGFTTVYQGNASFGTSGYVTFNFSTPFLYDGVSSLMVDMSYRASSTTANRPTFAGTTRSNTRSINYYTSGTTYGEPLTWSGTTPPAFSDTRITDIRLGKQTLATLNPASTGSFAGGTWSGPVTVNATNPVMSLFAQDGAISGGSASFETVGTRLAITPEPAFTGGLANTVTWNEPATGLEYQIERSTTPDFATPVSGAFQNTASTSYSSLIDGQAYHYRVRMRRGATWTSDWSPIVVSTQDATPPVLNVPPLSTTSATATLAGTASDAASGIASVTAAGNPATTSNAFANWTSDLTGLTDGSNTITITASDSAVPANTSTTTVSVFRIATPTGDPDDNGINSLLEHALGIPAGSPNPRQMLPAAVTETEAGSGQRFLCLQYRRRIQRAGLTYVIETSSDLLTWDDTGASIVEKSIVPTGDGITETVTVRVTPAIELGGAKFVRLRVTSN